ncbi:MAG: gallidermin family lantibiotic [Bacillota bacterium]
MTHAARPLPSTRTAAGIRRKPAGCVHDPTVVLQSHARKEESPVNKGLFDLDVQVRSAQRGTEPQVTSLFWCTPGTCYNTCGSTSTFHSNCCPPLITQTCGTCV